jgi:hypothetical protein
MTRKAEEEQREREWQAELAVRAKRHELEQRVWHFRAQLGGFLQPDGAYEAWQAALAELAALCRSHPGLMTSVNLSEAPAPTK